MFYHSLSAVLCFICFLSFYYEKHIFAKKVWIPSKKRYVTPLLSFLFPWFFAIVLIQTLFLDLFLVASHSMSPFVQQGQFVIVSKAEGLVKKWIAGWEWEENSVVLLEQPTVNKKTQKASELMVKRIFLTSKDSFLMDRNGYLYALQSECKSSVVKIKGQEFCMKRQLRIDKVLWAEWRKKPAEALRCKEESIYLYCKILPNHYFVIGDNFKNSIDSRNFGIIEKDNVLGRVFALPKIL